MDRHKRPKKSAQQHPLRGREPRGTKDSIADNDALLANIRGLGKGESSMKDRVKHEAFENDYVLDSIWWSVLEKRDEWDRIRDLPLAPSLRRALFTCAVNHGLDAAIAMLASVEEAAQAEAAAQIEVKVIQGQPELVPGQPAVQAARVIASKRAIKPRDYDFGERTLRYTKYQFYLLYRQPWVKKVIRRARDTRSDVA